ncbi:unnamed protein product [Cladocopium goreaui]|uniref:Reverse transcriptase domain-containing protein n=1 Tax=Cladocopium goreaui TaxID=2562237 RepID=A0A9P1C170_9DINO|nr:unnamed protein product [Cladocopium goreaui]
MWITAFADPVGVFNFAHLCSGAFHGWGQAVQFCEETIVGFHVVSSVAVDSDEQICRLAARTCDAQIVFFPWGSITKSLKRNTVVCAQIEQHVWMSSMHNPCNLVWTVSTPCQPFSSANLTPSGFNAKDGRVVVHVLKAARILRPMALLMENVDAFQSHEHFRIFESFAKWAGYQLVWSQVVNAKDLTDNTRSRWLGILLRNDLDDNHPVLKAAFNLHEGFVSPWHAIENQFAIPKVLEDVAEQCGIAPEACCDFLFFDGECQRVAVQPNALIDRISPSVNGKLVSLDTRVGEIEIPLIRLRAFPLPGGGKGNGKAQGKTNSSDFLQQNDPWAKIVPSNGGCRWDQLQLMENHPWFCKDTGKRLNQIPGVQLGPDKGGVVFVTKADLHELSQAAPSSTTLLLIPGFRGLQNLDVPKNLMMLASQQITVREPASNVQYKRLVVPFVLKGNVEYKVEETPGVVNVDSASFSELVVETHSGCMTHNTVAMMEDHPLGCFKKLITASGIALSEMSIYSYRKMKCADDQIIHQCMMKIPHGSLDELLKHSGQAELFVRQFIQPQEGTNHSILPRYFAINPEDVRSAKLLGESVGDGYRGLALTAKGVAIRASNAKLADARALVLQTDMRFTDLNRAVVSKYVFICQGYPWAISHKSLIEATFTAVKTAPIPLRSYRDGGMITWVLAFGEQPACNTFTVKMDSKLFEIVMTPQSSNKIQIPKKKSGFNGSIASVPKPWRLKSPHGKGSSGPAANATSATQINVSGDDRKYQQLADRVSKLEHGQVELSKKIDDKFDVVSDQLKQVLAAVVPKSEAHSFRARQDGHTGETPPSKSQRNQIYQNLVASGRCTAAWVAVSDRLTLLVVSVYGFSGAQSDSSKMARTNQLFKDIFEWLSQHGEIPIAIAADFQAEPHMYPCIAEAMSFGAFHDVLTQFNEDGMCRPITYSRDSAWVGGPATSIDGILLNNCALQYLQDVKVHVSKGLQHAFVDATFQWPSNRSDDRSSNLQWVPHASFDLTQLKSESERTKIAQDLWEKEFRELTNANKEHIPSEPVLEVIHDALKKRAFPISLPLLTDECLKSAVDKRKQTASPGVDGWRTAELQALPAIAFAPWARLWNKIEDGSFRLPTIFQCARLVMLPKPDAKSLMPIGKRLITLMRVPYIMWSKARFDHLQEWQQKVFPPTLCGGIQGRQAADIAHIIAARCEHAIAFQKPICGIKLDRSKCFDRIIPRIVADFAKILGMDPKFLKVWLQVYEDFRRFLCMGHAISKTSLSNLNGVAQGDAASVVAINILMTGWTAIVESIPGIEHFAFIDDCYLLALESNVGNLAAALTGTKLFDKLVGQKLNIDKSSGFATSRTAKKKLANAIPALPIHDTFAVLGTFVKTNAKRITIDPKNTAQGLRAILHDIEHLPISLRKKAFLISMKAVSKFLYHPEVIPWPKATIDSMVNSVAKALSGNRPGWRNQELLLLCALIPLLVIPTCPLPPESFATLLKMPTKRFFLGCGNWRKMRLLR